MLIARHWHPGEWDPLNTLQARRSRNTYSTASTTLTHSHLSITTTPRTGTTPLERIALQFLFDCIDRSGTRFAENKALKQLRALPGASSASAASPAAAAAASGAGGGAAAGAAGSGSPKGGKPKSKGKKKK